MTPRTLPGAPARPLALPLATLALALAVLGGCSTSSSRVIATVDGRPITQADFEHAARSVPAYAFDPSPEGRKTLLDELVSRQLLIAEAKRRGYDKGKDYEDVVKDGTEQVLPGVLYQRLVSGRVSVTEDEARALWQNQNVEWHISQIFTFDERDAEEAVKRLRRGMPFAQVALGMSKDRPTAMAGGDLGYLTSGQVPREMESAIRGLKIGEWAGPIHTPVGYYIVQVADRRPRQREPFEQTRESLMKMLRSRKERALVLEYIASLRQRRHERAHPEAYEALSEKWQNRATPELLQSQGTPEGLGFTPQEQAMPLESWDNGRYTIKDFFDDMRKSTGLERPSNMDDVALRLYVGDKAVSRMILDEARTMGLDTDPEAQLQLRDREDSYLITHLYEEVIVPSSQPTPEELERLKAQMGNSKGDPQAAQKLAQAQDQLFAQKRQVALQEYLARLRLAHPPRVDERALAAVPWPVAPKENS